MTGFTELLKGSQQHPYFALILAMTLGGAAGALLHRIGRVIVMRLSSSAPVGRIVLRHMDSSSAYALPLLFIQLAARSAPEQLAGVASLRHIISVLLIIALTVLLMRACRGFAQAMIARHPIDVVDNLNARRIHTQARVLMRTAMTLILIMGLAAILMTFPSIRTVGASLLASAGVAGLVAGMAARPVLGNLIAGVQIALTQPIRLDDVLIVENEWGWVEEITSTYVVLRIWDGRRLVIPLQWFVEHPFQNWTRKDANLMGTVTWWVDYQMPLAPIRAEIARICAAAPHWWDGKVAILQVTEAGRQGMEVRALVTSRNSPDNWELRCLVREGVIDFIQREYPQFLPRQRAELQERDLAASRAPAFADSRAPAQPASRGKSATASLQEKNIRD